MNRAFVKESTGELDPLPDLPISQTCQTGRSARIRTT